MTLKMVPVQETPSVCTFTQTFEKTFLELSATTAQGSTVPPINVQHEFKDHAEPRSRRPPAERRQAASCRASVVDEKVRSFKHCCQFLEHDCVLPGITALPQLVCSRRNCQAPRASMPGYMSCSRRWRLLRMVRTFMLY